MMRIWREYDEDMVGIWWKYDKDMVEIWWEYGESMVEIWRAYDGNMTSIWWECGRSMGRNCDARETIRGKTYRVPTPASLSLATSLLASLEMALAAPWTFSAT